jgi:hypothetical protein
LAKKNATRELKAVLNRWRRTRWTSWSYTFSFCSRASPRLRSTMNPLARSPSGQEFVSLLFKTPKMATSKSSVLVSRPMAHLHTAAAILMTPHARYGLLQPRVPEPEQGVRPCRHERHATSKGPCSAIHLLVLVPCATSHAPLDSSSAPHRWET